MESTFELARKLFPKAQDVVRDGMGGSLPSYQIEATAVADSADGTVLVSLMDDVISDDGVAEGAGMTVQGETVTIGVCAPDQIMGITVYGASDQNGEPTPETPVAIESVTSVAITNGTWSCAPNLLGNEVRSLPCGVSDTLDVAADGTVTLTQNVGVTTTAASDGIEGDIDEDVLSTTGEIVDGATVLYVLSDPIIIGLPPIDPLPDAAEGDTYTLTSVVQTEMTVKWPLDATTTLDSLLVAVPCSGSIEEGDTLLVTVQEGALIDSTSTGWGDRVNARAIEALDLSGIAQTAATEAQQVASDTSRGVAEAQALAEAASSSANDANAAAEGAQATADAAQSTANETASHFWADEGGAHVGTVENKAHDTGAGYNMTLGATDSTTGIILDHDAETLASFTPSALNFYADGQVAGSYTKDGVGLFAQDENDDAQQVAAFTASGVTFFDGAGNDAENILATFGKDGAVIGAQGGTQVAITDQLVAFVDGGDVVASISGQELEISAATVTDRLSIGNFAWIPRSNGNLALKWMG